MRSRTRLGGRFCIAWLTCWVFAGQLGPGHELLLPPVMDTEPVRYWPLLLAPPPDTGSLMTDWRMPVPLPVASASSMSPRPAPTPVVRPGTSGSRGIGSLRETVVRIAVPSVAVLKLLPPTMRLLPVPALPLGVSSGALPGAAVRTCGWSPPSSAVARGSARTDDEAVNELV